MQKAQRIEMRTAEALVEGDRDYLCAEPEIILGELDGPVGTALATLLGDQVKGHTHVFAILNSDVHVKPATLTVSKVTVKDARHTGILMGTVQAGIAHGVLEAVRVGDIPKKANDLGIIYSVWLEPAVLTVPEATHFLPRIRLCIWTFATFRLASRSVATAYQLPVGFSMVYQRYGATTGQSSSSISATLPCVSGISTRRR